MTDIATVALQALYRTSPTSIPRFSTANWPVQTISANHGETHRVFVPNLTQITRSFSHYATIEHFAIVNLHATSRAEISWRDTMGHLNTQVLRFGRIMVIPDIDPAFNLVLHGIDAVTPVLYLIMGT